MGIVTVNLNQFPRLWGKTYISMYFYMYIYTLKHIHVAKITVIRTRAAEGIKPSSDTPRYSAVGPERTQVGTHNL